MNSIFLTVDELAGITGFIKSSAQLKWLRQNGFTALKSKNGRPIVSRAHFEAKMGGLLPGTKPQSFEPNFGAI